MITRLKLSLGALVCAGLGATTLPGAAQSRLDCVQAQAVCIGACRAQEAVGALLGGARAPSACQAQCAAERERCMQAGSHPAAATPVSGGPGRDGTATPAAGARAPATAALPPGFPRAEPPPVSALDLDGITLGMRLDDARATVRSIAPRMGVLERVLDESSGAPGWVHQTRHEDRRPPPGPRPHIEDVIELQAEVGPLPAVLTAVRRFITFGKPLPSLTETEAALRKKYGPPSAMSDSFRPALHMRWHFTRDGRPRPAEPRCFEQVDVVSGKGWETIADSDRALADIRALARDCGITLIVYLQPAPDPGRVQQLRAMLIDPGLKADRAAVFQSWRRAQPPAPAAAPAASPAPPSLRF